MKLLDRYKISLHNIKNNKSRSILTTIIVYIISLLIMTILCIGISFSNNMSNVIEQYYENGDEPIETRYYLYEGQSVDGRVFNKDVYTSLDSTLKNHESIISYLKYDIDYGGGLISVIGDHRFPMNEFYEVIEGDNVNKDDHGTNKVLVSAQYASNYYNEYGEKLNPGDTISYNVRYNVMSDEGGYYLTTKNLEFVVKGIYNAKDVNKEAFVDAVFTDYTEIVMDAEYLFDNIDELYFRSAAFYYHAPATNFDSNELEDKLEAFVDELNKVLPQDERGETAYCYALSDLKMSNLMGLIVIAFAAFLCLVLILLSIGSLANTIMISVDKNKKFIGLLKALGLNEKDLKSTIKMESITTIVLGILLAYITLLIFSGLLADLNALLINSMFSMYITAINYEAVFTLPIYVPIIVVIFFIAFTLLFARNSMSKIAKTDPISVISEVA